MKKFLSTLLILSAAALFLLRGETAADAALTAMTACGRQIIPSLFPFMTLSSFLLLTDGAQSIARIMPMSALGLSPASAPVLLTGLLSGFPVGAAGCEKLFREGTIGRREAAVLSAVSSHISPAFAVGVVGKLWGDRAFGLFLYLCAVASAFLFAALFRLRMHEHEQKSSSAVLRHPPVPLLTAFCIAVSDAASASLRVTAFLVLFRVLCALFSELFPAAKIVFSCLLEFSLGCAQGSKAGGLAGACITGFCTGFSGLCIFMQLAAFLAPHGIALTPLFLAKTAEGLLTAAAAGIYYHIRPMQPAADAFLLSSDPQNLSSCLLLLLLIIPAAGSLLTKPTVRRHNPNTMR